MTGPADLPTAGPTEALDAGLGLRRWLSDRENTDTVVGRGSERDRRVAWTTAASIAARAASIAVSLVTVPLVVTYLGSERYGLWLTISSMVALVGPLDLGVGNGLRQVVADAFGRGDELRMRHAISTAIGLLGALGFALLAACPVLVGLDWPSLLNVTTQQAQTEAGPTVIVLVASAAIGLPLSAISVTQAALQAGYIAALWSIAGTVLSVLALVVVVTSQGGLPLLAGAMTFTTLVVTAINGIVYFGRHRPELSPRLREFQPTMARTLLGTGVVFLVLQVAGMIGYEIDNIVISRVIGPEAVQQYAIPMKLFMLTPAVLVLGLMPLWPAYREAAARGDMAWVRRTLRRSVALTAVATAVASVGLVVFGPAILAWWVGDAVTPTPALLIGMGLWAIAFGVSTCLAMLLNAADVIKSQAILAIVMATVNLALSVALVREIGVAGAVYGSLIAQVSFILIPFGVLVPAAMRRLESKSHALPL